MNEDDNHIVCKIEEMDFLSVFSFSTRYITELIRQCDVVFLLDCPWMSAENLIIKERGSLRSYCNLLKGRQRSEDVFLNRDKCTADFKYYYKSSVMRDLGNQIDRIMGSDILTSGGKVRLLKSPLLERIERTVNEFKDSESDKLVYIFTSEIEGLNRSKIAYHPFTRTEKYDGKNFTIIRYYNRKAEQLQISESGRSTFAINLWSVIKYISADFGYIDFKHALNECLGIRDEDFADYIGIYRSILTSFELDNSLLDLKYEIRLCDSLNDCLNEIRPGLGSEATTKKILDLATAFLGNIYSNIVFSDRKHYGNDAIRDAFLMNLYSSISDINTMLFWHNYRMLNDKDNRSDIHVQIKCGSGTIPLPLKNAEFKDKDFFMDKKLYDILLKHLEKTNVFPIVVDTLISETGQAYQDDNMKETALLNIIDACKIMNYSDSAVYRNACECLADM